MPVDDPVFSGQIAAGLQRRLFPGVCNNLGKHAACYFHPGGLFKSQTGCSASTKVVMVGLSPQTGHCGARCTRACRKFMVRALKISSLFVKSSPHPVKNFTASAAWMVPNMPATAPRIPAFRQHGYAPF